MSDLNALPLSSLKKMAQVRRIKQYYILPKARLVELLSMAELPSRYKIEKMTIIELRDIARQRELRGFWNLNKYQLTRMLFPENDDAVENTASHQHEKNDSQAGKHQNPENQDTNQVRIELVENSAKQGLDNM
jgi:hypothetical protein